MNQSEAIALIRCPEIETQGGKNWLDLGSGTGTFALALASLLPPGSEIHAFDLDLSALNAIPDVQGDVRIEKHHGDFIADPWPEQFDGLLMANALHFVKDKESFLSRAHAALPPNGIFLLVEYDMDNPNAWVPYPFDFRSAKIAFKDAGFSSIRKLNERPSAYNRAMIYAACISK